MTDSSQPSEKPQLNQPFAPPQHSIGPRPSDNHPHVTKTFGSFTYQVFSRAFRLAGIFGTLAVATGFLLFDSNLSPRLFDNEVSYLLIGTFAFAGIAIGVVLEVLFSKHETYRMLAMFAWFISLLGFGYGCHLWFTAMEQTNQGPGRENFFQVFFFLAVGIAAVFMMVMKYLVSLALSLMITGVHSRRADIELDQRNNVSPASELNYEQMNYEQMTYEEMAKEVYK